MLCPKAGNGHSEESPEKLPAAVRRSSRRPYIPAAVPIALHCKLHRPSLSFRPRPSPCHFERSTKCEVEKSVLNRAAALLSAFRLPTAELRSATPRYGPSQNLLRHHFVITCIFRAPSPCPLRGWICPPCGSLKALHRSAAPSCNSPYTAENAKASNIKVLTFSGVAGEHK